MKRYISSIFCLSAWAFASSLSAQVFQDATDSALLSGLNSSWGSSWADLDNDGDMDVITHGHVQPFTGSISQIWRNNGDGTFTDITVEAGYWRSNGDVHGVTSGDFDNDGDQDFYVVKGSKKDFSEHEHDLMRNNGDGTFTNVATAAQVLGVSHRGRGGSAVDFNVDGYLDLFFSSFSRGSGDLGNMLFRNDGALTFTDVAPAAGISRDDDQNRTASWADYNSDGRPDMLVMYPCTLYANRDDGTFEDVTAAAGIMSHVDCSSSAWADYNNDGLLDVYVTSGGDGNTLPTTTGFLYRNNGDGTFSDVTATSATENAYDARGVVWGDYDNDGWRDLYIVNDSNVNPNRLLSNNGDGTFSDVTIGSGAEGSVTTGIGVDATFVDYNNDGALDLFITNGRASYVGEYLLLQNQGSANNWLKIELVGTQSNRDGLMARVEVTTSAGSQMQENNGPSHYMSQDSSPLHFGLGGASSVGSIRITWPSGVSQLLENIEVNQMLVVEEPAPTPPATFEDVTDTAGFFGLNATWAGAWGDYNADGYLDVYTAAHLPKTTGSVSQLWQNNGNGTFSDVTAAVSISTVPLDRHAAMWADLDRDRFPDLTIGKGSTEGSFGDEVWKNHGGVFFENIAASAGLDLPAIGRGVYAADYDLDGDLDVAGLGLLAQSGVTNRFFRNDRGMSFTDVTTEVGYAFTAGTASRTASWADYDADGYPDLFLAPDCTLLRNQGDGTFADVTEAAGIQPLASCSSPGWADYDNDGDIDIYVSTGWDFDGSDRNEALAHPGFLYRNDGNGAFTNVTALSGTSNPFNGRSVVWGDYDNDGFQDLYISNGGLIETDNSASRLLRNLGDGKFRNLARSAGVEALREGGSLDASFVDYNNDGFLDIFVTNGRGNSVGPLVLLQNQGNEHHWLKVKLRGYRSNRSGIMTKLTLTNGQSSMFREHNGQTHYMAQDDQPVHFGLGQAEAVERLELLWPSGRKQRVENIAADQTVILEEGRSIARGRPAATLVPGCEINYSNIGWQLRCRGAATALYKFKGRITSNGEFTDVTGVSMESNDSLVSDNSQINFDLSARQGVDIIRFSTTGRRVTIDLTQNGAVEPSAIRIGKYKVMPAQLPLTLTR